MIFKLFCVILVIGCAFAEEEARLPAPCAVEDVACFSKARKEVLEKTAAGIPKYGLKAFDPLAIPSFKVEVEDGNVEFKNLKIVGFKNEEVTDLKLDRAAKVMTVTSKQNLKIDADFDIVFPKQSKTFSGKFDATTATVLTASYNYELKTDDKGAQHFHTVSESVKCEPTDVNVVRDPKLEDAVRNDPEVGKKKYTEEMRNAIDREIVCKIIKKGLETLSHNLEVTAAYYPVTAFFSNF